MLPEFIRELAPGEEECRPHPTYIQKTLMYVYRDHDGELFYATKQTLSECRVERDEWRKRKEVTT